MAVHTCQIAARHGLEVARREAGLGASWVGLAELVKQRPEPTQLRAASTAWTVTWGSLARDGLGR